MLFGIHLVRKGLVSADQLVDAIERQLHSRPPIGRLALETQILSVAQVFAVLEAQVDNQEGFGQIAIARGYMNEAQLAQLLLWQQDRQLRLGDALVATGALSPETRDFEFAEFRRSLCDEPARTVS